MIRLTIQVDDIATVISIFSHIRLYVSTEESGTYTSIGFVELLPGTSTYTYDHLTGTEDYWYKSSYWSTSLESNLSDAVQGRYPQLYHWSTYPEEFTFGVDDTTIIRKIRRYIGDFPKLERLYLDDVDDICSSIHSDGKTIDIGMKGWPVYISITQYSGDVGTLYVKTSNTDPTVQGYRYLTFSGTLNSGIINDVIDVWFYSFKFSDREIYEAYGDAMMPPYLTSDTITKDHLILQASIDLLENMTSEDMVDDGATIQDDADKYDPSPGLRERDKTIKRLKEDLNKLVKQYMFSNITGVLID
jgi:hypothetical protein